MTAVMLTLHSTVYLAQELTWASTKICSVTGGGYAPFKASCTVGTFNGLTWNKFHAEKNAVQALGFSLKTIYFKVTSGDGRMIFFFFF